ncbi:nitrate- and nitrite sensing domain-containing protein [Streptomyces sp. DH12]|uniref:sensor histidine kinase n=1 Tax=Streptomyces sp. DH12 TaxID=2857010 RepID=UPI001E5D88FB|nr:nitrate- and nitrite sensing domain-containing protein [Streptomyces sp. DH12]
MRLRTLLVLLAVVPTAAMAALVAVTADRLLDRSSHLRSDVLAGERLGLPLYELMRGMQAERTAAAARWADPSVPASALRAHRAATDRAAARFRAAAATTGGGSEEADRRLREVLDGLDALGAQRERADSRTGGPDSTVAYYDGVVGQMIRFYQDAFGHTEDGELGQESRVLVTMFSASEMVAREGTLLALAGPSRKLETTRFAEFVNAVGAHRYLYDRWVVPHLPPAESDRYARLVGSEAWQAKTRVEDRVLAGHEDLPFGVRLPREAEGWTAAHAGWSDDLAALDAARLRGLLDHGDAKATGLEREVTRLLAVTGGALLAVVAVVAVTTRSVLRRLRLLHDRTVAVAEHTLPDVVERLRQGRRVDEDALPRVRGERDEVGRVSDAFARVVAVSVDGQRQLAAERDGFGGFAAGIASRTGNLVSRQLALTEELQDAFGGDEALLGGLMRADQLTVGMRRQVENLLILAGGEVPDPHTEPMRVADLLREAAAEVEDFRRIDRHALDEISVEAGVISQVSHLLAELLDNATRFSPPRSRVVIRAELVADGLSVEIEDRGPRVSAERYAEMNARLHSAPPYAVLAENAHRLGLFVVGHLADRLGATVTLRRSVYGGTAAVVLVPHGLLVPTGHGTAGTAEGAAEPEAAAARLPARSPNPAPVRTPPPAAERDPVAGSDPGPEPGPQPETAAEAEPAERRPTARDETPRAVPRAGAALPVRRRADAPPPGGSGDGTARPRLPERVPQTHLARQLRTPPAADGGATTGEAGKGPGAGHDGASPEEVADAWAEYEDGTRKVEEELRQDQP